MRGTNPWTASSRVGNAGLWYVLVTDLKVFVLNHALFLSHDTGDVPPIIFDPLHAESTSSSSYTKLDSLLAGPRSFTPHLPYP